MDVDQDKHVNATSKGRGRASCPAETHSRLATASANCDPRSLPSFSQNTRSARAR